MNSEYLDGKQFYQAFAAGYRTLASQAENLNRINVFPVADGDTGTNLSLTLKSIVESSEQSSSIKETLSIMADLSILSAQGSSGLIFAQYLMGLNNEVPDQAQIRVREFAQTAHKAVKHVYDAILNPVEGTILTVMKDWADSLRNNCETTNDFSHLLHLSLIDARQSLQNTPSQLKVLAEAGVLDAGAQGFVYFLEGFSNFLENGCKDIDTIGSVIKSESATADKTPVHSVTDYPEYRYCTECILTNCSIPLEILKEKYKSLGDSFILAGNNRKLHLHIHTNQPDKLFYELHKEAEISRIKADDMLIQYNIANHRKFPIGLMTDTAADLPQPLIEYHQILQVPFGITFKNSMFLDKFTLQPDLFYKLLRQEEDTPRSSVPSLQVLDSALNFMTNQYEKSICLHISSGLSAAFQTSYKLAEKHPGIAVMDSRHLSVTQGLILLRIAQEIEAGMPYEKIICSIPDWSSKTYIYTDIATLEYMVRGGRVSPLKGFLATLLNIKPIVSVDKNGKGIAYGKSFSRKANLHKILNIIRDLTTTSEVWDYAIVHSDAEDRAYLYAKRLSVIIGKPPAYIMPLSPVVGVHNGIGAVAVGISLK